MQVVAVDILGPFPDSPSGNRYILDYFTRWAEAYAIPNQEASTVAEKLVTEFFLRFSPPQQLHSDRGRQFESALLREIFRILGIHKTHTTPYHPQSDGLVERFNRTLLHMLATSAREHPATWANHLPKLCMAYNTSVQSSTGYTPFFLMFGREARLPIDIMYGSCPQEVASPSTYAAQLKSSLQQAFTQVRDNMSAAHNRQKEHYDRHIHGKPFQQGDLVWLHNNAVPSGQSRKLHCPWSGPYIVLKQLTDCTYQIKRTGASSRPQIVHFNRLKVCTPDTRFNVRDHESSPPQATLVGQNLEIHLSTDDTCTPPTPTQLRRYPSRVHRPPNRFTDAIYV